MMYPLVLALAFGLVSSARAVQYGAASNNAWRLSGPHMNVPVNGCTSYPDALALFPGASATYSFNGTAISVLGLTYNGGTDAVITVDGANVHSVAADSNAITCKLFASISGLDGTRVHTLSIVVSKKKSRRAPPPPPGQPNGGDIGGGNQGSSLPAAFPIKAVES
ncbi:hypothetical protein BKA62DRAFT_418521 [Auriculariales sp. MPI-PUGE-AT-0066]|nr:hypothetical protein BKA62DRAFT_418521 [Auriculariales sp. MPI-PUGE-AT-0066]